jgi:hypothetical protein
MVCCVSKGRMGGRLMKEIFGTAMTQRLVERKRRKVESIRRRVDVSSWALGQNQRHTVYSIKSVMVRCG